MRWGLRGRTTVLVLATGLLVLTGCGGEEPQDAGQRSDDVLGPVDPQTPSAEDQGADDATSGDGDQPSSDGASDNGGGAGAEQDASADDEDASEQEGGTGAGRPPATALEFTAGGSVLTTTSGPSQDHVFDGCPIEPHVEQNIVDCAFARGSGGEILLTVEEFAGDHAVVVWERPGVPGTGPWEPVRSATYGASEPDVPIEGASAASSAWPNLADVVILEVDVGGSGGLRSFEVIGWPAGASGAQVLAVTDPRPAASLRAVAGRLLLTANHLAPGDATCCPSEREIVVLDHPSGSPVPADRTYVARDARLPVEVALEVYAAWRDQDLAGATELLTSSGEQNLGSIQPGPAEDIYALRGRSCTSGSQGFVCVFEDTGGGSMNLRLTVRRVDGGWQVDDAALA